MSGLSTAEIKNDLKALRSEDIENDTDSDSNSIKSDDILDSVYPVQPRRTPKAASDLHTFHYQDNSGGSSSNVEDALFFIRNISKSHKELFDSEKQREDLELYCQVRSPLQIATAPHGQ